jgi:hypothetical protein
MAPRTLAIASLVVVAAIVGVIFVATRSSSPTSQPEAAPTPAAATPVQAGFGTTAGCRHARAYRLAQDCDARASAARAVAEGGTTAKTDQRPRRPSRGVSRQPRRRSCDAGERAVMPVDPDSGRMALHAGERRGRPGSVAFYTLRKRRPTRLSSTGGTRRSAAAEDDAPHSREPGRGPRRSAARPLPPASRGAWKVELRAWAWHVPARGAFTVRP